MPCVPHNISFKSAAEELHALHRLCCDLPIMLFASFGNARLCFCQVLLKGHSALTDSLAPPLMEKSLVRHDMSMMNDQLLYRCWRMQFDLVHQQHLVWHSRRAELFTQPVSASQRAHQHSSAIHCSTGQFWLDKFHKTMEFWCEPTPCDWNWLLLPPCTMAMQASEIPFLIVNFAACLAVNLDSAF